ncbi:MAG: hypothetical protein GSR84_07445 [Desulfurococcales archaeon]|nr:hypothetical protein [Desulfurococcales archaeon]
MSSSPNLAETAPRRGDKLDPIIDILAYFTAARRYGYVDALAGALNPEIAKAVIADALRDFEVSCGGGKSKEECVKCPSIDPDSLRNAIEMLDRMLGKLDKPGKGFFETIRSMTLKALSRAPSLRIRPCKKDEGSGS